MGKKRRGDGPWKNDAGRGKRTRLRYGNIREGSANCRSMGGNRRKEGGGYTGRDAPIGLRRQFNEWR